MGGYEIIEHTADVGVRAGGATLEEAFEQTTLGLIEILGAEGGNAPGTPVELSLEGPDLEALLVDWLNEVIYVQESRDAAVSRVQVRAVSPTAVVGTLQLTEGRPATGTAVKAATWHRIRVEQQGERWGTQVYLDI